MRTSIVLTLSLAAAIFYLGATADAQVAPGSPKKLLTLKGAIAKEAKLKEETVERVLKAFGPAFEAQLRAGREVKLPGVGSFRVVRINEYRDLDGGRPVTIPAKNYVEFVADDGLNGAANAPGAVPSRTIEGYEFRVNPNSTQGIRTDGKRNPGTRTK